MTGIKNTADLRQMLLDVIGDVRSGLIGHQAAKAISSLSTQILKSAKLDLDAMKACEGDAVQSIALIGDNQQQFPRPQKKIASRTGYIGKREKTDKAEWYPEDWAAIQEMMKEDKSAEEIAETFGVTVKQLEDYIFENDLGEAEAPAQTGAKK